MSGLSRHTDRSEFAQTYVRGVTLSEKSSAEIEATRSVSEEVEGGRGVGGGVPQNGVEAEEGW